MNRRGMTLIELIIGAAIIGISFYVLISIFITILPRTARIETLDKKVYLAQEKMEEYLARSFDNISGEAETNFGGGFSSYKYQILVTYVATSELNWAVAGPTPFKNVKVRVWGGQVDPQAAVEITTLVATYEIVI